MKTIVILLLITLSFAFIPERSFLQPNSPDTVPVTSEIAQETTIEEPIKQVPRLQRQNAIRFPLPLSDSEDSSDLESTSDSDSFQVDQTYFSGLNSSFIDLYNEWNKENLANEAEKTETVEFEEIVDKNLIKEGFDNLEVAFEGVFDEVMGALKELSKEAEEKKTIMGVDKSTFKELFESVKGNFEKVLDQVLVGVAQVNDESGTDNTISGLDKETVTEYFNELEDNADEIFDNTLLSLSELAKESEEKKTIFGFGKEDIKKFFDQAEESFEKLLDGITIEVIEVVELDYQDENKEASDSDLSSTDGSDVDNTYSKELNSTEKSLSDNEVNLDEVLLAIRNLFNETVEEKALFNETAHDETLDVDNTNFNVLSIELNQDSVDIEVDFDRVFAALSGLVNQVLESEKNE